MTAVAEPLTECKTRNAKAMENKTALSVSQIDDPQNTFKTAMIDRQTKQLVTSVFLKLFFVLPFHD